MDWYEFKQNVCIYSSCWKLPFCQFIKQGSCFRMFRITLACFLNCIWNFDTSWWEQLWIKLWNFIWFSVMSGWSFTSIMQGQDACEDISSPREINNSSVSQFRNTAGFQFDHSSIGKSLNAARFGNVPLRDKVVWKELLLSYQLAALFCRLIFVSLTYRVRQFVAVGALPN